ncbi:MAG: tetratricopeptide repeat protein [Candidatus Binatia bacterium]
MIRRYQKRLWCITTGILLIFVASAWADPAEDAYAEGVRLAQEGLLKEAIAEFDKAIRLKPTYAEAFSARGNVRNRLVQNKRAIEDFDEAIRLNPQYTEAYYNRANAYMDFGQREKAVQDYGKTIALNAAHAEAFYNRGLAYAMLRREEAAADARSYLELRGWKDERALYIVLIGYLGYRYGSQDEDARKLLEEAKIKCEVSTWPYPIIHYLLGEDSAQELLKAATDNDKRTEAHAYIGIALSVSGKRGEALTHLKWVKENGNKGFVETTLATTELGRLDPAAAATR